MAPAKAFTRDFSASFLVFLVALPLCLGIAIASGAPPARGLVTGIIGGILAGTLAGAPLAVSGPAAGLTVLVFQLVSQHGLAALGPIVLLGGALQVVAGIARIGAYVRAMPPAIVEGMLAAIGITLIASQWCVMIGTAPAPGFIANILAFMPALHTGSLPALLIGLLTIGLVLAWETWRPRRLRDIPGALPAVAFATLTTWLLHLNIAHVPLPDSLGDAVSLLHISALRELATPAILAAAFSLAMIASIESLLSAAAIDRMTPRRKRSDYSRELIAQGIGNMACGLVGALPMTGVIARSAANVRAGARTRASAIMHGMWLLLLVAVLPGLLRLIPTASLAGLLIIVGVRLIDLHHLRALARDGLVPLTIYSVTLVVILFTNLLDGVLTGLAVYGAAWGFHKLIARPA
jgi:MFS superfamily sulfate permease-like transporter